MHILDIFRPGIHLPRVIQETDSHCGPATLQLLFAHQNRPITQDEVITAARVRSRIQAHGTRPDHLARAVARLAPDLQFWFKQRTSVEDLETLLHQYHWPVAINWQGLFYDTEEEQNRKLPAGEQGHYSVVTDIHIANDKITIADPYSEYSKRPRVFSLEWFEKRWWDVDHEINKKTGQKNSVRTKRFIFVLVPKEQTFPASLKMKKADAQNLQAFVPKVNGR